SYFLANDPGAALTQYERALEYREGTEAVFQIGWSHRMIGTNLLFLGRIDEAEGHLHKGLAIFAEAGDTSAFALHVRDFATLALARNDPVNALRLAGATAALEAVSETRMLDFVANSLGDLGQAIDAVGEEEAEKLLAEGRSMSVQEILDLVAYRPEA
ncbi:MAG: hypothetical protein Q8Q52_06000, partial [Acidimicrobiia bacterium]|nr:hypothetical protein [Acidimicrobiia bacterium]